jgi:hypothetical protein
MLFMLLLVENSASGNDSAGDGYVDTYSMINIIATPDLFAGKNIRTIGVATIGFESDAIYLTADDARVGVGVNGIGLSFEGFKISEARKRSLHMKHVLVEGTYVPWQPEAPLFWRGSLKDLKLIYALEDVEIVQPE